MAAFGKYFGRLVKVVFEDVGAFFKLIWDFFVAVWRSIISNFSLILFSILFAMNKPERNKKRIEIIVKVFLFYNAQSPNRLLQQVSFHIFRAQCFQR